jgi:hypothetical protein
MIVEDFSGRIRDFKDFLEKKLVEIDALKSTESPLFKKILYVSYLDSIAACIYPNSHNKVLFLDL